MSWSQEDLDALESAMKSGSARVKYQDREVEYRSLNEMLALRDLMRKALGLVSSQITAIKPKFSKGF
jgi:hypothetical protein